MTDRHSPRVGRSGTCAGRIPATIRACARAFDDGGATGPAWVCMHPTPVVGHEVTRWLRRGIAGTLGVPVLEMPWALGLALAVASLVASAGTAAGVAWSVTRTPPVGLVAARE